MTYPELERWKAEQEARAPLLEGMFKFSELAVKSLLLLNGGAAVALLALAGQAGSTLQPAALAAAVTLFGLAAALAVAVAGASWLSQACLLDPEDRKWVLFLGQAFRAVAVVAWSVGLGLFVWGVWEARIAILKA